MVQHRYQWCYLYAFVQPSSGRTWWLLLPTVSVATFTLALAKFAQAVGAGYDKHILLGFSRVFGERGMALYKTIHATWQCLAVAATLLALSPLFLAE